MAGKFFSIVEETSGFAGLVLIFVGIEMFSGEHNVVGRESVPAVVAGVWGLALVVTSRRGAMWRIYFRLASVALVFVGSVLAAISCSICTDWLLDQRHLR